MRVAVFGGSGFIGYDFVRRHRERWPMLVYTTNPASVVNLARHAIEIEHVPVTGLAGLCLPSDVEVVVNCAHPFGERDGVAPGRQADLLLDVFERGLRANPRLRLLHLSTMSVYEPFAAPQPCREDAPLQPPPGDSYACSKLSIERRLRAMSGARERTLILRPTVVYGPYCRPWTDRILAAFDAGDVVHQGLKGRFQPLFVEDLSRCMGEFLTDFQPGIFNVAGAETLRWVDFLAGFEQVVGRGRLVAGSPSSEAAPETRPAFGKRLQSTLRDILKLPAVKSWTRPVTSRLPDPVRKRMEKRVVGVDYSAYRPRPEPVAAAPFCAPFFEHDRLVDTRRLQAVRPLASTPFAAALHVVAAYSRFRFSDQELR